MNHSQLNDLITIVEWLAATKTPPPNVEAAFDRLRSNAQQQTPYESRPQPYGEPGDDNV